MLEDTNDIMKAVRYIIGTFLATLSVECIKNEEVLLVLEDIKNKKVSIEDVFTRYMEGTKGNQKKKTGASE